MLNQNSYSKLPKENTKDIIKVIIKLNQNYAKVHKSVTCTVFPRPISSARMPFKLLLYSDTIHLRPLN